MRVAILGTGLIGGSVGLALRRAGVADEVIAFDRDPAVRDRAVERGAATRAASSAREAVEGADLVFVAAPVGVIPDVVAAAAPALRPGVIVTDVGSTKSRVVRAAEPVVAAAGGVFVGGHPMAGTEEEGIDAAKPGLFEGAWWILTPTAAVHPEAYQTLHGTLTAIGAQVMALDPERHDELLAIVSHLPHLTATALMNLAVDRGREHAGLLALAAGGFRDVTRVAASNAEIWLDICRENRGAVSAVLDDFAERLLHLRRLIESDDRDRLRSLLMSARAGRRSLRGKRVAGDPFEIRIPVPDRPGVLSEVTTLVGDMGINIEDLDISHGEEGGRGVLRLTIVGDEQAHAVAAALESRGLEPRVTRV